MFEVLLFPVLISAAAFIPGLEISDKKKIKKIFENTGYGIRKKDSVDYPIFKGKKVIRDGEEEIGYKYSFNVPLGLPASKMKDTEKAMSLFSDGLRKPVLIDFDGLLHINVYDKDIPALFKYVDIPESDVKWQIPLGKSLEGMVWHNTDHIPHMTAAGTTRFGKTVILRTIMTYLIEKHPKHVEFDIIDLKGGLEFSRYECIRQIKSVAIDAKEAEGLLTTIWEEVQQDYVLFRKNHWSNIVDTPLKRRRFLIIDEAAQLTPEKWMDKDVQKSLIKCQDLLGRIAAISGALGYRIIFATQYPTADTLPRTLKMNADAKLSFRLPAGYASEVAIDARGAEELPSNIKGRALFKTHEIKEIQTPYLTHDEMWERLGKYQEPVILEGEAENVIEPEERVDLVQFG